MGEYHLLLLLVMGRIVVMVGIVVGHVEKRGRGREILPWPDVDGRCYPRQEKWKRERVCVVCVCVKEREMAEAFQKENS